MILLQLFLRVTIFCHLFQFNQAFSGLDEAVAEEARMTGNTALDAALNAQFLVQIGVFTAVPMIMGFILELGLLKVCQPDFQQYCDILFFSKLQCFIGSVWESYALKHLTYYCVSVFC